MQTPFVFAVPLILKMHLKHNTPSYFEALQNISSSIKPEKPAVGAEVHRVIIKVMIHRFGDHVSSHLIANRSEQAF